ncbi:MAG: aldehyde dehydrogenase family protein, partial [Steroidobacteraceae bacterium]
MGGKNPLVVHKDANLEHAVEALVAGGLTCSGQWCVGTSRVLVHREVYQRYLELALDSLSKVRVGDGFDSSTTMGPLIS